MLDIESRAKALAGTHSFDIELAKLVADSDPERESRNIAIANAALGVKRRQDEEDKKTDDEKHREKVVDALRSQYETAKANQNMQQMVSAKNRLFREFNIRVH